MSKLNSGTQIKKDRILKLNNLELSETLTSNIEDQSNSGTSNPVIYWMNRDIRDEDNWALLYAQEIALKHKAPLIVLYNLAPGFLGGGLRQHVFKVGALKSLAKRLSEKNIGFSIVTGDNTERDIVEFVESSDALALVTDFFPLKLPRKWIEYVRKNIKVPMYGVDTHNTVPCWITSNKQEFGAYTIRPKLYKLLPEYLEEFPKLKKHPYNHEILYSGDKINWKKIEAQDGLDIGVIPVDWIKPDHDSATKAMKKFFKDKLEGYGIERNDPNKKSQSDISPYLHYGILSAQRIALEVLKYVDLPIDRIISKHKNKAKIDPKKVALLNFQSNKISSRAYLEDSAGAFLEELIVRRELSDNFCFYNANYDNPTGFPDWAKKSHEKHSKDKRDYLYTKKQFEDAKTHDDLWNAAQLEMVKTGKMHGYMRMYWAKKILEWTKSPEEAMKIAIYLNDKYELDGRDPNGYAGIAWSIGGVHDRAWFGRPVYGLIRYMSKSGCESKFDVGAYISRWIG